MYYRTVFRRRRGLSYNEPTTVGTGTTRENQKTALGWTVVAGSICSGDGRTQSRQSGLSKKWGRIKRCIAVSSGYTVGVWRAKSVLGVGGGFVRRTGRVLPVTLLTVTVVSVGMATNGTGAVDYSAVDLPDKQRTEWHYTHRRAELLELVQEAGHPDELNQSELADRYGVSQQQISKDMDRLGEHVRATVGTDRRALVVDSVIQRSIRGMLDEGEYRQAAKTAMEWDEWVGTGGVPTGDDVERSGGAEDEIEERLEDLFSETSEAL